MKKITYVALVAILNILGVSSARGEAVSVGDISREVIKTLPDLGAGDQRKFLGSSGDVRAKGAHKVGRKRFIEDTALDLPEEDSLASPIAKVVVSSPLLKEEIAILVEGQALRRTKIQTGDLARVRQQIWDLGLTNKKLLHVKFKVVPNSKENGESWLIVTIKEIVVRKVNVVSGGDVPQVVLDNIQREASQEFYQEKILDLDELDNSIKNRLRLGDVFLRSSVVPVDETHIDLKVFVRSVAEKEPTALIQYDNAGGWSFGRDRLVGGASFQAFLPGDVLSLIAMKTADVGNGDYENGMYFGRAEYMAPLGEWGVKLNLWASGLHYHEVKSVSSNTQVNGEAIEFGQGLIRPVYTDTSTMMDVRAEYVTRYTVDRVWETMRTGEKGEYSGRVKSTLFHSLGNNQTLQSNLGITVGTIDLSGSRDALLLDQSTAKSNGVFTKFEGEGAWLGKIGDDNNADFRIGAKGQWTPTNLDSSEKFSLGGATGMRAFGSGEASGDIGFMASAETGYTFDDGIRPFVFYDLGQIWKSAHPWTGEGDNLSYVLQDLGAGVSVSAGLVDLGLTFAHQVGANPGVTSQGLDIDNSKQHYRVWTSLSYRY